MKYIFNQQLRFSVWKLQPMYVFSSKTSEHFVKTSTMSNFSDLRSAERCVLLRSRQNFLFFSTQLSNEALIVKFGVDTAENEPSKACPTCLPPSHPPRRKDARWPTTASLRKAARCSRVTVELLFRKARCGDVVIWGRYSGVHRNEEKQLEEKHASKKSMRRERNCFKLLIKYMRKYSKYKSKI